MRDDFPFKLNDSRKRAVSGVTAVALGALAGCGGGGGGTPAPNDNGNGNGNGNGPGGNGDRGGTFDETTATLTGADANDALRGDAQVRVINAAGGDDTITGGAGDQMIDGGEGVDTAVYRGAISDYLVTPMLVDVDGNIVQRIGVRDLNGAAGGGDDGNDTLTTIEMVQFGMGDMPTTLAVSDESTDGNDILFGTADVNGMLDGGAGNDAIAGFGGGDTLSGGLGSDWLHGGGGNDEIVGGAGDDTIDGGAGEEDRAIYDGALRDFQFTGSAVAIIVTDSRMNEEMNLGMDTLTGIETIHFDDEAENIRTVNILFGTGNTGTVMGRDRADRAEETDIFNGTGGGYTFMGGAGKDVFQFLTAADSTASATTTIMNFDSDDRIALANIAALHNLEASVVEVAGANIVRLAHATSGFRLDVQSTDMAAVLDSIYYIGGTVPAARSDDFEDSVSFGFASEATDISIDLEAWFTASNPEDGDLRFEVSVEEEDGMPGDISEIGLSLNNDNEIVVTGGDGLSIEGSEIEVRITVIGGNGERVRETSTFTRNGVITNGNDVLSSTVGPDGDEITNALDGMDTMVYMGPRDNYIIWQDGVRTIVVDKTDGMNEIDEGHDTLTSVEILRFGGVGGDDVPVADLEFNTPGLIRTSVGLDREGKTNSTIHYINGEEDASRDMKWMNIVNATDWFRGGDNNITFELDVSDPKNPSVDPDPENYGLTINNATDSDDYGAIGRASGHLPLGNEQTVMLNITVTASLDDDKTYDDLTHVHTLTVSIRNQPAVITHQRGNDGEAENTRDVAVLTGNSQVNFDLDNWFSDPDGDTQVYTFRSGDSDFDFPEVTGLTVSGGTISGMYTGAAPSTGITINVDDNNTESDHLTHNLEIKTIQAGDDITGTDAKELLFNRAGDKVINGGAGIDTVAFHGVIWDYAFTEDAMGRIVVTDRNTGDGVDEGATTLVNINDIWFGDGKQIVVEDIEVGNEDVQDPRLQSGDAVGVNGVGVLVGRGGGTGTDTFSGSGSSADIIQILEADHAMSTQINGFNVNDRIGLPNDDELQFDKLQTELTRQFAGPSAPHDAVKITSTDDEDFELLVVFNMGFDSTNKDDILDQFYHIGSGRAPATTEGGGPLIAATGTQSRAEPSSDTKISNFNVGGDADEFAAGAGDQTIRDVGSAAPELDTAPDIGGIPDGVEDYFSSMF